jgi:hypothetical protein
MNFGQQKALGGASNTTQGQRSRKGHFSMTPTASVPRGTDRGNTFVPPSAPLPGYEQGKILYRLGYSLGVCISDAQAGGWLDAEAAGKEARNG